MPSTMALDSMINLGPPASSPFVSFIWTFQKDENGSVLALPAAVSSRASSVSYTAQHPDLKFKRFEFGCGALSSDGGRQG